ncbi:MAG: hypothetical protein V7K76_26490 [Nostoc sp.]|uniref:hypothetical protein n=1 Tax=Nostoc sp. TaxID=1180 RepID=UPI002FF968BD
MNLQEVKNQFPEAVGEIETLERLGFASGALEIKETLPKLQLLAQTDKTIVAGWWSVGEEAEDSVTLMTGGEPPLRKPYNLPTN